MRVDLPHSTSGGTCGLRWRLFVIRPVAMRSPEKREESSRSPEKRPVTGDESESLISHMYLDGLVRNHTPFFSSLTNKGDHSPFFSFLSLPHLAAKGGNVKGILSMPTS
ncbi:hypothetical protein RHMOL_Rhmol11G0165400 [Rhododendron molle]|uniref:Uncharacterized protein n=1 Tax=Rhododendron molle TaxID=49168 RepID=A0ACC0LTZ9_RHOML|nr:hypothetical protein RHMOL_Rhmol11G0165400 [Rhododendron molle]